MNTQLESLFDEAENRYLNAEELRVVNHYVSSLPARLEAYRTLRDQELEIMQWVADQLQTQLPQERVETLERSIRNALLVLRSCAMGMLLNDEAFAQIRLVEWLGETMSVFASGATDRALYRLLNDRLTQMLNPQQLSLINPPLLKIQTVLLQLPTAV